MPNPIKLSHVVLESWPGNVWSNEINDVWNQRHIQGQGQATRPEVMRRSLSWLNWGRAWAGSALWHYCAWRVCQHELYTRGKSITPTRRVLHPRGEYYTHEESITHMVRVLHIRREHYIWWERYTHESISHTEQALHTGECVILITHKMSVLHTW